MPAPGGRRLAAGRRQGWGLPSYIINNAGINLSFGQQLALVVGIHDWLAAVKVQAAPSAQRVEFFPSEHDDFPTELTSHPSLAQAITAVPPIGMAAARTHIKRQFRLNNNAFSKRKQ